MKEIRRSVKHNLFLTRYDCSVYETIRTIIGATLFVSPVLGTKYESIIGEGLSTFGVRPYVLTKFLEHRRSGSDARPTSIRSDS